MLTRSTRSKVTFLNDFMVSRNQRDLPAGTYEIVIEEELLQGLSFEAYQRTATYMVIPGRGYNSGQSTMQIITKEDLENALERDRSLSETCNDSDAALSPLEELK